MKHYPISVRQVLLFTCKEELFRRSLAIFIKALFFFFKAFSGSSFNKTQEPKITLATLPSFPPVS